MEFHYTDERNVQIVLALLKENNIRKVIVSPGATNESVVASMQHDPFFEMYSCVDERSAAYMACGLAVESGEIVVLSCTGATSSRNYLPGLTEAYYRHIPILAITSSLPLDNVGQLRPQCTNRSTPPVDSVKATYCIDSVRDYADEMDRIVKVNDAIANLKRNGGGPVHINLITRGSNNYDLLELPPVRTIRRVCLDDKFPDLKGKSVLIFIGEKYRWTNEDELIIDDFCSKYNSVVLCDHTSGYKGKYRVLSALIACQDNNIYSSLFSCDVLIHIGGVSGDYPTTNAIKAKEVWRVDEDGEFRDKFRTLTYVFEMSMHSFFSNYTGEKETVGNTLLDTFADARKHIEAKMPELPFSNGWIASVTANRIPAESVLHLGILNSLRCWNLFEVDKSVRTYCNVGGFGIDGIVSTLIGASLHNQDKLYFAVLGDLAFFYDLNSIGNRNISSNLRIMLINNGRGVEFHTYKHSAARFGEDTDKYISAFGHNGIQSPILVKEMANALGFEYLSANDKTSFLSSLDDFVNPSISDKPMIFEVFTEKDNEVDVYRQICQINGEYIPTKSRNEKIYDAISDIAGNKAAEIVRIITSK